MANNLISIGEMAARSGVAPSALRFYEEQGLLSSVRGGGGRRYFQRDALRRIAFIRAAQAAGLSLEDIKATFASLPDRRTPSKEDWELLASSWRPLVERRIDALVALRDQLTSCIGCGCLSLKSCALYNPQDWAAKSGSGARYLLGDRPNDVMVRYRDESGGADGQAGKNGHDGQEGEDGQGGQHG